MHEVMQSWFSISNKKLDAITTFNLKDQNLVKRICQITFNLFRNQFIYLQSLKKTKSLISLIPKPV
jgi:hypothetical protein